jgi:hypothetical protein
MSTFRKLWYWMFGLDEETVHALLSNMTSLPAKSRSKLRAIRVIYHLSFVPEHREVLIYNNVSQVLLQVIHVVPAHPRNRPQD